MEYDIPPVEYYGNKDKTVVNDIKLAPRPGLLSLEGPLAAILCDLTASLQSLVVTAAANTSQDQQPTLDTEHPQAIAPQTALLRI